MSKMITHKCVDCGKERTAYISKFSNNVQKGDDYRCPECARKYKQLNNIDNRITHVCFDCGKERTAFPSCFSKNVRNGGVYRCPDCAIKLLPNPNPNVGKSIKVSYKCIDCGTESTLRSPYEFGKGITRENYRCKKCALIFLSKDPKWLKNVTEAAQKRVKDPKWKEQNKIMLEGRSKNPNWRENCKNTFKRIAEDPILSKKRLDAMSKMYDDPTWVENHLIGTTGEGMWYGNKHLTRANNGEHRKYYCESWNPNLWDRIDAAYDYKSILSGKTRFENYNQEHLSRHHLYWQEKACCEWDEDANGYYAWIDNSNNNAQHEWIKYYIKGDPNKFVLLTRSEHMKIRGSKKSVKDKIYYIKLMGGGGLVEEREKQGKKCYLTPEEYEVYKVEHADIIEKYKK